MTEIVTPFAQFFDTSGKPLANGAIYIGIANLDAQTNPIAVYWDEALTIPASQPIRTLNGYPAWNGAPARLYANAASYSITVRNAQNRLMYSAADVTSASLLLDFQATLASQSGSSLVGFINNGTGAVARTAQDKMRDTVSVDDYGAVGDGIANDTVAIQSAINAANGRAVVFSASTYLCSELFLVSNLTLIGSGSENTIIKSNGTNVGAFIFGNGVNNVTVENLQIDFADIASVAATSAIGFFNSNFVKIRNCKIVKFNKVAIAINSTRYFWIENNYIERATADTQGVNQSMLATETGAQTTQYGWIKNNTCVNAGTIWQGSSLWIENNRILNWRYGAGIGIAQTSSTAFNYLINNRISGSFAGQDSDVLTLKGIENFGAFTTIAGNVINGASGPGIFNCGRNAMIFANQCYDNNTFTAETPSGGIVLGYVDASYNASSSLVYGNNCFDNLGAGGTQQYGILIAANIGNLSIANNTLEVNKIGRILANSPSAISYFGFSYIGTIIATPGTITNGASYAIGITLAGANLGNICTASCDVSLQGMSISAYVNGVNNVIITITNNTGSSKTLGATTFRVVVADTLV
jgi:hypothetical protein